jgi:4-amino-4-deoxy-L-arabinose transferase-like glycosyltransferase
MTQQIKRLFCSPVFIVVFAFAARMLLLYHAWKVAPAAVKDFLPYGYELGQVARSIAAGHGFASPLRMVHTGPTVWFTPIYPYLVAGIFKVWGIYSDMSHMVIQTLNYAFSALTIVPIYSIARRTFGEAVAVAASWFWVFLPTSLFFPLTWIWDTSMTALFLALIFWATLAMREPRRTWSWAAYGALWGIGVLVNPSVFSLFPFLVGWLLWESRRDGAPWIKYSFATILVFAVALVPWTIRNYRVFGKFIVLRSNFGLELWLGNNPDVPDSWSPWMHPNDNLQEALKYKRMGEIPYMAEKQQQAFAFIRTHPMDTIRFTFHRFVDNWLALSDSPLDSWSYSPLYLKLFMLQNILLTLFTLLGALFAYRTGRPEAFPYAMVLLIFPLVFYLTHASLRYRFPMDPIMMVLSAYGLAHSIAWVRGRFAHRSSEVTPARPLPTS